MKKTIRYTSSKMNKWKFLILKLIDDEVLKLKNEISSFVYKNIKELILNKKEFIKSYKIFRISLLTAWETQTLFHDICTKYEVMYERYVKNKKLFVQDWYIIWENFFDIVRKQNNTVYNVKRWLQWKKVDKKYERTMSIIRESILREMKQIEFTTWTHFKSVSENWKTEWTVILKTKNKKYKYWLKYKINREFIYLPLDWNDDYSFITKSQILVKMWKRKVHFLWTYDEKEPKFKKTWKTIWIDVNIKNNLFALSDWTFIDIDREFYKNFIKDLKKIDKSKNDKHRQKLIKRNEWYFKLKISKLLDYCQENKIVDIVVEDLNISWKSFAMNEEFNMKYSRLVRLLRINNIKNWLLTQAEKRWIRVHITNSHYTSQQCSKCWNIDRENRKSQENFCCIKCWYENNADLNAAINIYRRYRRDVLYEKLHEIDDYWRMLPKKLSKDKIREILQGLD